MTVADRDRPILESLRLILGRGSICDVSRGPAHWQPRNVFSIRSQIAHRSVTIPFMDEHLLPCAKREQFERWRDALYQHERAHPNRYG